MTTSGIILVGHEVLDSISQAEMLAALPYEYRDLPRAHVSLSSVKASLSELDAFDWITARNRQQAEVVEKLEPLIRANPGWRVQYFGAAPIPLAMALGYQLSGWANADVYQKLHEGDRSWKWPSTDETPELLTPLTLATERLKTDADVVARVSFSAQIHADDTASVVTEPLGQVDLMAQHPNEDLLRSPADLEVAAAAFSKILDWAHDFRPNAQIHLLAAVTVGAAFRMGMCINPTIHGKVQTYQYFGNRYERAFVLQDSVRIQPALTGSDRTNCSAVRVLAADELATLRAFTVELSKGESIDWLQLLFDHDSSSWFSESVRTLASVHDTTPLRESTVDETSTDAPDGFRYTEQNKWELSDVFLHTLRQYLPAEEDQRLALRLFFLHEAIHRSTQRLRQSLQIRRFPKVVEELDYQADVWAYLHELARQRAQQATDFSVRATLMEIIRVAIGTFWAFASAADPSRMEIRVVNRYLIWYWKRLQIEALPDDNRLDAFLQVMAEKPVVEIAGARVRVVDDRVCFLLDEVRDAEIAVLSHSKLYRFGHGNGSPVANIFRGFRDRDDDLILSTLRAIADQVI